MTDITDDTPLELGEEPKRGPGRPKGSKSQPKADAPPRTSGGKFAGGSLRAIKASMSEAHAMCAVPLMMVAPLTAQQLMLDADAIGEAWMNAAEQNPKLRKALESFAGKSTAIMLAAAYKNVAVAAYTEITARQQQTQAFDLNNPQTWSTDFTVNDVTNPSPGGA